MQINASDAERTAALLLSGVTTYVMNAIGNSEEQNRQLVDMLKQRDERIKTLDAEISKLESEIEELHAEKMRKQ